jgi:hypothetical protein
LLQSDFLYIVGSLELYVLVDDFTVALEKLFALLDTDQVSRL